MTDCEAIETCPFFNDKLANMPTVAGWLKIHFCKGNYQAGARFTIRQALGGEKVPSDLFPNDTMRAERLIAIAGGDGYQHEIPGSPWKDTFTNECSFIRLFRNQCRGRQRKVSRHHYLRPVAEQEAITSEDGKRRIAYG